MCQLYIINRIKRTKTRDSLWTRESYFRWTARVCWFQHLSRKKSHCYLRFILYSICARQFMENSRDRRGRMPGNRLMMGGWEGEKNIIYDQDHVCRLRLTTNFMVPKRGLDNNTSTDFPLRNLPIYACMYLTRKYLGRRENDRVTQTPKVKIVVRMGFFSV